MKKTLHNRSARKPGTDPSPYPKGWNRKRAEALIDYYENQTDDEAIAEAEAAYNAVTTTMMQVPVDLVGQVQKLIAKRAS
jgi:hypothetical protein